MNGSLDTMANTIEIQSSDNNVIQTPHNSAIRCLCCWMLNAERWTMDWGDRKKKPQRQRWVWNAWNVFLLYRIATWRDQWLLCLTSCIYKAIIIIVVCHRWMFFFFCRSSLNLFYNSDPIRNVDLWLNIIVAPIYYIYIDKSKKYWVHVFVMHFVSHAPIMPWATCWTILCYTFIITS